MKKALTCLLAFMFVFCMLGSASAQQSAIKVDAWADKTFAQVGETVTVYFRISGGQPPYEGLVAGFTDQIELVEFKGALGQRSFTVLPGMPQPLVLTLWVTRGDPSPYRAAINVDVPINLQDGWQLASPVYANLDKTQVAQGQPISAQIYLKYVREMAGYHSVNARWTAYDQYGSVVQTLGGENDRQFYFYDYQNTTRFVPRAGVRGSLELYHENPVGDGSATLETVLNFDIFPGVQAPPAVDQAQGGIPASLNQRMATRSGPGTKYTEDLGTLPITTPIVLIEAVTTHGTPWGMVEFQKNGKLYRAYTGMKRIDASRVPKEGSTTYTTHYLSVTRVAFYGPGEQYAQRSHSPAQGTEVRVYSTENGFYLCDYQFGGTWVRAWLRGL